MIFSMWRDLIEKADAMNKRSAELRHGILCVGTSDLLSILRVLRKQGCMIQRSARKSIIWNVYREESILSTRRISLVTTIAALEKGLSRGEMYLIELPKPAVEPIVQIGGVVFDLVEETDRYGKSRLVRRE